jgi:hypothetical protein
MTQALFTSAELDQQISAYKKALIGLATAQSYTLNLGSGSRMVTKADLPQIRQTLEWLQTERVKLTTGAGPQIVAGRVRRG